MLQLSFYVQVPDECFAMQKTFKVTCLLNIKNNWIHFNNFLIIYLIAILDDGKFFYLDILKCA